MQSSVGFSITHPRVGFEGYGGSHPFPDPRLGFSSLESKNKNQGRCPTASLAALMTVGDPELEGKLLVALEKLSCEGEAIATGIAQTVVRNLKVMARMGVYFEEEVQRRYPEFETRRGEWSWEDYLPPMSRGLRELAAAYN